jgi:hypothetical protein
MQSYFLYRLVMHRRVERDDVGVVAQWERYVEVLSRDEVVKSNVVKSGPPTRQEDR